MFAVHNNFGCEHYKRSVKLVAPCCSKVYYCRFCHDEKENHKMKRTEVTVVQCARCDMKQRPDRQCFSCKTVFGKYTCLICNLFDHEDKKQFHCSKCGICRVGGKGNYFHCEKCNLCLNINIQDDHVCVENASRSDCSLCLLNLHESVKPLKLCKCGHILHEECYKILLEHQYDSCPICRKDFMELLDFAGKP